MLCLNTCYTQKQLITRIITIIGNQLTKINKDANIIRKVINTTVDDSFITITNE